MLVVILGFQGFRSALVEETRRQNTINLTAGDKRRRVEKLKVGFNFH
jgi:hypothetical protein